MRKPTTWMLVALLSLLPAASLAQENVERRAMMLQGTVVSGNAMAVTAPVGATVDEVLVRVGDTVSEGDLLFTMDTTKVYAQSDGMVAGVRAQPGDDVATVQERYTGLMYIEPSSKYTISTSTSNAYDSSENNYIHVGETVYLRSNTTRKRTGIGFVTLVDSSSYNVEITAGNLELDEYVDIYRDPEYVYATKIGTGKIARGTDVAVTETEGTVYKVHVAQGDQVKRGDLLMEIVTGSFSAQDIPSLEVAADYDGVIATVDASAGDAVTEKQVLATVYPAEDMQIAVDVTESNLVQIAVGDRVRIEMENIVNSTDLWATVASISGLSNEAEEEDDDEASYTAYLDFDAADWIREGMSVNAYFNDTDQDAPQDEAADVTAETEEEPAEEAE